MTVRLAQTAAARQRALEVLAEQSDSGIPVIPERIAAEFPLPLPISSSSGFPPRVYGALYKIGNDFSIVLSAECPTEGHRRFTLSHELGHFFLDGHLGSNATVAQCVVSPVAPHVHVAGMLLAAGAIGVSG